MTDHQLKGRRVLLAGEADQVLLRATQDAFQASGCLVSSAGAKVDPQMLSGLDIFICFARPTTGAALLDADAEDWERALERFLQAPQRLAMAAAREMAMGAGGSIVIVGSVDAYHAYPGRSVASVAMGGLLGLVRSMGVELAASSVRVNLVLAGPIGDAEGEPPADTDPALIERSLMRAPLHRLGRPEEAVAAIRFVAGPDAGFMTGQTLRVDGGWASLNQTPEGMRFP